METKNNTQKTVNSRVKKMILRGSAVVFSLVLISLTLSAQNFWDQFLTNSSNDNMVLLRTEQNSEFEKVDAAIEAINYELEAKTYISAETFVCETDIDKELAVEAWMTDETYFSTNTRMIREETDEALNLED